MGVLAILPKPSAPKNFNKQAALAEPPKAAVQAQPQPVKETTKVETVEPAKVETPIVAEQPAPVVTPAPAPAPKPVPEPTGTKYDWMRQAGINPADYGAVDYIISKESGWNPHAVNASSGAAGLPQALPYSKTGCARGDPICQLRWADQYAKSRYGSWWASYDYWQRNRYW